ncbi:MAG: S1 RNA-binding domain-containing protein, partial [Endomicrobium sp.]|nr:S1 RNA-binding domain-containing protein [Endomicrobium sp.]
MALDKTITKFEENEEMSMEDLMKDYDASGGISSGKEITVTIVGENEDGFLADLGIKSEGLIPKKEFEEGKIPAQLKPGASVKVKVLNTHGQPVLSYRQVVEKEAWDNIEKLYRQGKHVHAQIVKTIKGGFIADIGVDAFMPISQIDTHFVKEPGKYIGKSYEAAITEFDRGDRKVVVSRRKLLEDEKAAKRASVLESIAEGQIVDGTVARITNFGAFVD